jgi:hypothetical protein
MCNFIPGGYAKIWLPSNGSHAKETGENARIKCRLRNKLLWSPGAQAHPASYQMDIGGPYMGEKLTPHFHLVPRLRTRGAIFHSPNMSSRFGTYLSAETTLPLPFTFCL